MLFGGDAISTVEGIQYCCGEYNQYCGETIDTFEVIQYYRGY